MSYKVYRISYAGAPRDHHAIFVESKPDQSGQIFQVAGDIQSGMRYESKPAKKPEDSATFQAKLFLGSVSIAEYDRIDVECRKVPPPAKQFNGPKRINPQ
ncbi:hypothetical protein D6C78_11010 [Aureobasidium pullulans]|uniref:Uncharacterized protein n=1 Tax=Aureobasidium pullulans TaxID=5580 RepID=A0A4T0B291_AURPU|nr:hypothetical protein D6C78_11010 [Aureobasidium pullulans]